MKDCLSSLILWQSLLCCYGYINKKVLPDTPHFPHNKADATNSCGRIFKMKTEMYSATAEKML